jgi:hypothetical protein
MDFTDTLLDRRMFSTDTNEYATGLNDENEWQENIMDYDIPLDMSLDGRNADGEYDENLVYNESGFDQKRIY